MFLIRFDLINRDGGLIMNFCLMMVVNHYDYHD